MERREVQEDLADVDQVVTWADALAAAEGLDDHVRYAIQVCLEEGLANLIVHGRTADEAKSIAVTFEAAAPGATVTISDACAPFDVTAHTGPEEPMSDMPLGGLGLRLLRSFATTMAYAQGGARNVLTLTFAPPP